jgi:superfamily II DNA or RNA helicase
MKMRPYQQDAALSVMSQFSTTSSTLVVMPTGLGKTVLFADVIRRMFPRRALVLAHREELIFQAKDKIERVTGLTCGIEMASLRVNSHDMFHAPHVIVSSIQTQCSGGDGGGRMTKFNPMDFGLVVIDEAHHATAGSYRRILDYYKTNPALRVLGVTATPDRSDEEALGQIYDSVAYDYKILDAISDGWLVPIEQQMVNVAGLDFSNIRTTAGDLNGGDLAEVMEFEENLHGIATPSLEIIGERRALVFAASVAHAERLSEIFNRHKEGCSAWVCGKTPKDERRQLLSDYAAGKIQIVCNCGVLTEGFDDPGVEVVIMGRPTKSRALYAQMIGRATRPLPGIVDGPETPELRRNAIATSAKKTCQVVDFCGNSGRHKLMSTADILGGNVSDEAIKRTIAEFQRSGKSGRMDEALEENEKKIRKEIEKKKIQEAAKRARLIANVKYNTQKVNPFDVFAICPQKERGWDAGKKMTSKQLDILTKQGIENAAQMPYGQAKQLLTELFRRWDEGLCSFKQAKILKKHGLPTEVKREEASRMIDGIFNPHKKQEAANVPF